MNNDSVLGKIFLILSLSVSFFAAKPAFAITATGCVDTQTGQIYNNNDIIVNDSVTPLTDQATGKPYLNRKCVISLTTGSATWQGTYSPTNGATGQNYSQFMSGFSASCNVVDCGPTAFYKQILKAKQTMDMSLNPWVASVVGAWFNSGTYLAAFQDSDATAANGQPRAGGAIGFMASAIGGLYENKPASTVDYINNIAQNAGFTPPIKMAYAAGPGIGFTSLKPVMKLWEMVRGITYVIFSVIFVIIGLMILLRIKIDPKTVITIQNALPRIIFSLVLITFSYPIAGFLIDMMYVLIGVILSLVQASGALKNVTQFTSNLQGESIFGLVGAGNWFAFSVMGGGAIQTVVNNLLGVLNINGIVGNIAGTLGGFIIAIAILYALVKTWLSLLGAYVNILVGVILSPLAMLGEAIPGVGGLSMWLRSMLSNILAFPLVIILLVFGASIMEYGSGNMVGSADAFVPPLIGGNSPTAVTGLIGLGILLMIPKAVEIMQQVLKSPAFKPAMAWQEAIQGGPIALYERVSAEKKARDERRKKQLQLSEESRWREEQAAAAGWTWTPKRNP